MKVRRSVLGPVCGAALLACAATAPAASFEFRSVAENAAVLYDAPSAKSRKLYVVNRGYPLEVVVAVEGWSKVRDASGELTWIENRHLADRRTVMVKVPLVPVRDRAFLLAEERAVGGIAKIEHQGIDDREDRRQFGFVARSDVRDHGRELVHRFGCFGQARGHPAMALEPLARQAVGQGQHPARGDFVALGERIGRQVIACEAVQRIGEANDFELRLAHMPKHVLADVVAHAALDHGEARRRESEAGGEDGEGACEDEGLPGPEPTSGHFTSN